MGFTLPKSLYAFFINKTVFKLGFYVVIFIGVLNTSLAQELDYSNVDLESDSARGQWAYRRFIDYVSNAEYDSAIYYANIASKIGEEIDDSLLYVKSGYALGFAYKQLGLYKRSAYFLNLAKEWALEHPNDPAYQERLKLIYNVLGVAYYNDGIFEQALEAHLQSIDIRNEEIDRTGDEEEADLGVAFTNIGLVYYRLGDLSKAIDYQHKAITSYENLGAQELAENFANLGLAYSQMGTYQSQYSDHPSEFYYDSSIYYFHEAIKRCEYFEECSQNTLFTVYNGLGITYEKIDVIDSSAHYLNLAGKADQSLDSRVMVLHNQALLKIKEADYISAMDYLQLAKLYIDSTANVQREAENNYLSAVVAEKRGDFEQAYRKYKVYDSLNTQIFNENIRSKVMSLQIRYSEGELRDNLDETTKDLETKESFLTYAVVIIILVFFFAVILFRNNLLRKRANRQLFEAKQLIEEKNIQLGSLNNELEERVKERTFELNSANEALQQSNLELDNFIYKTSHDIRGPLATLQGICNVALMDVKDTTAIDYLQKLGKTAAKLNEILSKLLVINQINNSMIASEAIDFEIIIDHVVQDNRKVNAADIAVIKEVDPELDFKSDYDLVKIIISNLVNNAFKYHNQSDRIESFVKIKIEADTKNLRISIVDNGVGIDEEQGDRIFEIFSKATQTSDSAGLGLYLVKLAVEKLKGQVRLSKTREKFTEFRVKLPLEYV